MYVINYKILDRLMYFKNYWLIITPLVKQFNSMFSMLVCEANLGGAKLLCYFTISIVTV